MVWRCPRINSVKLYCFQEEIFGVKILKNWVIFEHKFLSLWLMKSNENFLGYRHIIHKSRTEPKIQYSIVTIIRNDNLAISGFEIARPLNQASIYLFIFLRYSYKLIEVIQFQSTNFESMQQWKLANITNRRTIFILVYGILSKNKNFLLGP